MELSPLRLTALTTILILSWLGEILAGDLANVTATPNNVKAGENSIYTINFTTSATGGGGTSGIPVDGKIVIDFSSGFTVSGVLLASAVSGIDGGFSITRDNTQKMVTLTRDGTGSAVGPSTAVSIRIANVGNETNDGSYNLTVETQTNAGITIDGPTWSSNFTITPADLSYFTLTGVPASVVAGANFPGVVTVTAYDLYGNQKTNYTGTVSWSSTDTDGDVQLPGNYTFVPADNGSHAFSGSAFRLVTAGGQTVTVADGTVSKESSVITVTVAALASFTLNNPGTQTAGTGFSLTVTGAQDQWGNAWSGTVTVSFTDGGGHVAPNGSSPSLSNITVSNGSGSAKQVLVKAETGVQLRASSGGIIRDTNGFKVEAGNLSYFTLSGVPASVTAGNNFPGIVTVTAYDLYGNQKTNYTGTVSWSSTDTDGDVQLPPNYTFVGGDNGSHGFSGSAFRLVTAGGQTVTVADGPVSKESSVITVNVAALSNFTLNNPGTRTAGTGFSLTVTGAQDQWGNAWSGTVTVSFTDGGSHVAPNGSSPSLSNITVSNGSGSANQVLVKAETGVQLRGCAGGITKDTNPFTVTAGALSYVKIVAGSSGNGPEYTTNTLAVGGTFVVHAAGYDAYGNYRSDENVTWAVTGGIGTVAPGSGTATTFTATTVGEGTIIADHATALDDATGAITVTGGSIAPIILRDAPTGGGNIVNDKSMTADDQLTLYAAGYDGGNNYLGDVSVTWSSTGTLAPAVSGTGSSLTFSPTTAPASGKIRASYSPTIKDSIGVISVSVGGLKAVKVVK
ncbi:MAG: hypothetical protein ONB05_06175, partial [candidate division KSB1 bacterium]|nr:hypothetical protein [candidate division KSB1 bacterium]